MRQTLYCCLAITLLLLSACSPAAEPDTNATTASSANAHVGTWTLNLGESSYSPGPAPKSQTVKIEAWGDDGLTYVTDGVGPDDQPTHADFQAKFDGMDYPIQGNADADAISYHPIDANTLDATLKRNGTAVINVHVVVSPDGNMRTVTQTGKDAQDRDLNIVSVYHKQ